MHKPATTKETTQEAVITTPAIPTPEAPMPKFIARMLGGGEVSTPKPDSNAEKLKEMRDAQAKNTPAATTDATTEVTTPAATQVTTEPRKVRRVAKEYRDTPAALDRLEQVANSVEKLAQAVTKQNEPAPMPEVNMTAEQKRTIEILSELESLYPEKFQKGISSRATDLIPQIQAWDVANPKASEEDRETAISAMEEKAGIPEISEKEMIEASTELKLRPLNDRIKEQEEQLRQLNEGESERKMQPVIEQHAKLAADVVAEKFGEPFQKLLEGELTKESVEAFIDKAEDPIAAEVGVEAIRSAQDFATATVLAFSGKDTPRKQQVGRFAAGLEQELMREPVENRLDGEGRQFVPRKQFIALPKNQRDKYWTMTPEIVIDVATKKIMEMADEQLAEERAHLAKVAPKLGFSKTPAKTEVTTEAAKPVSPTSGSPVTATPSSGSPSAQPAGAGFLSRMKTGTRYTGLEGRVLTRLT